MAILSSPLQYLTSIPPATRVFAVLLIVQPAIFSWLRLREYNPTPYMLLVPGTWIKAPWTLVSSSFVETDIFQWIFSMLTILLSCKYLERLWGTTEIVKFSLITLTISNIICVAVSWIEYAVLGSTIFLYDMKYCGMTALQTGVLVAFTQLIPEHQVQILGVIKIRVKRFPMIYVTISTILCLLQMQAPWILIQFGWLVSWTYLRFYKKNANESGTGTDSYGDRSETFAFVHWFPPFLHYPISLASDIAYNTAVRVRVIRPFTTQAGDAESGFNSAPGGTRAEAERRRAMALKALDQRVANATTNVGSNSTTPAPPYASSSGGSGLPEPAGRPSHSKDVQSEDVSTAEMDGKGKGKALASDDIA